MRAGSACRSPGDVVVTATLTGTSGLIGSALAALGAAGHPFRYPGLEGALRHVLGREPGPAGLDSASDGLEAALESDPSSSPIRNPGGTE